MIHFHLDTPPERPAVAVAILGVLSIGLIATGLVLLLDDSGLPVWPIVAAGAGYLVVAHVVRAHADTDELGWLGGLIDNPFSLADDANRGLLLLSIVLLPGRVMSESIIGLACLPFRRRVD